MALGIKRRHLVDIGAKGRAAMRFDAEGATPMLT
jgi:hypothetical protein